MVHFISRYLFYAQKNNQRIRICAYTHRKKALIEIMCATAFRDLLISALEIVPPEITLYREMRARNCRQKELAHCQHEHLAD